MGEATLIEWTDRTFQPWIGCTKVHAGCTNCYAEAADRRWPHDTHAHWGKGVPRRITSDENWKKPIRWARQAAKLGRRERVFFSMGDPLDEEAPKEAQERFWQLIRDTAHVAITGVGRGGLDWLLLTKRPERWRMIPADVRALVWLGTSVSDAKTAKEWIARLLSAQGFRLRFLSMEPLIGPVDMYFLEYAALDWIIVGGESGQGARPCAVEWIRSVVKWATTIRVPVFVKQLGARPVAVPRDNGSIRTSPGGDPWPPMPLRLKDKKGGDPAEWPADLRVRQLPEVARG